MHNAVAEPNGGMAVGTPSFRLFFVTGFLGAYTTFSTFSLETVELLQRGEWAWAALNVGASVTLGLLMTALGMYVGKQFA